MSTLLDLFDKSFHGSAVIFLLASSSVFDPVQGGRGNNMNFHLACYSELGNSGIDNDCRPFSLFFHNISPLDFIFRKECFYQRGFDPERVPKENSLRDQLDWEDEDWDNFFEYE